IYFQGLSCCKPELKLQCTPASPIIDPHLSPDGTMLAYVSDSELHVLNLEDGEVKPLTSGAGVNCVSCSLRLRRIWCFW
ncbi:hypothetical protein MKW98_006178, partial [Papaver atlanticum]